MPVARGFRFNPRSVIVLGLTILAIGVLLGAMVLYLAENGGDIRLGENQFADLRAEKTARRIDREGPILFPDVSGGQRIVYLSHTGDDPLENWYVFDARAAGAPSECVLQWVPETEVFADACDPDATYPIDGEGLRQYAVYVNDADRVVVDFNVDPMTTTTFVRATTTTEAP